MTVTTEIARSAQYLTFVVGDEEYGVGIQQAKEIIEVDVFTGVPNAPDFVRGVINLRGSVVPVVDLAVKFGQSPRPLTRRSCIVVVEVSADGGTAIIGMLADRVSQVAELGTDVIEPPPSFGTGLRTDWLVGLGRAGKRFLLLLDIERTLGADTRLTPATLPEAQ